MALTLPTNVRNAACDAIVDLVDVSGPGKLEIGTTSMAVTLVTNVMAATAFGAAATGVATAAAIVDGTAGATGTAAECRFRDGADADVITGMTVGSGSGDLDLSSTSITSGDTVSISSFTVTVPAS